MSKRVTSFLVLAAAVLLAIPAQAQQLAVKKAVNSSQFMATKKLDARQIEAAKAAKAKANDKSVGIAFRGAKSAAVESKAELTLEQAQALKAADQTAGKQFKTWDWAAHQAPQYVSKSGLVNTDNVRQPLFKFSGREVERFARFDGQTQASRRAATTDEHGIITAPDEGVTKYYTRTGTASYVSNGSAYNAEQSGIVTIVECVDAGTVYIKDPISRYAQGTWVKGTKDGNTITVAAAQPLAWNTNYSTTLSLNWGNVQSSASGNTYVRGEGDITFTVDDAAGTITLDGSSQDKIIAVFWDDDNSWSGYGDYGTVWTLNTEYEPASTDPIVLPDGAEVQNWYADGTGSAAVPTDVKVAFVGNEVYISGLTSNFPEAWIKGTLDGTTVTFSKLQFVGMYNNTMPIWAVGADSQTGALQDFTMTYDSEAQTLALDANQLIVFNAAEDRMYYLSYIESLTIYAEEPAPSVIETLPYVNSFDDAADQKHFTIIDANADGRTWNWYSGMARYTYSSTNQGDDWLVSPAIKLVAGKKYAFSIAAHAQSASYPERIEVKAAQENTAEALAAGTEVLPSTDVTTPGFVTYENNEFTVAESGYYYIGVHAISDADKYYLSVDDFVLDAAPITAPYVADFTTEAPFGDFFVIDNNEDGKTWTWSASNFANYTYSSSLAADDYLVLPITLEAGKSYDVTVNAANSGYPEKFEVKVGKTGTVEGLSTVAIAETEVTAAEFTDFSGSFTTDEAGTYYVAIHATSDADQFRLKVKTLTIEVAAAGNAPAAVNNLVVTPTPNKVEATIVFEAPSVTIDGNEMTENLTNIDVLRDGVVIESVADVAPGSERTIVDNEEKGLTIGTHKYQVIPYNASGIGAKSDIIEVMVVTAVDVPYTFDFSQAGCLDLMQVIDNNADGKTWQWSASNNAYCDYSSTLPADDYLVTLPVNLVAGKKYAVSLNANCYSASYAERLEVVIGKEATAAALTTTVLPAIEMTTNSADDYEAEFTVAESGQYYLAVHAISDANMWYPIVNKLTIEAGAEPTAPGAPAIEVLPTAEGDLSATIKVTAPTVAADGESALEGDITIEVYANGEVIETKTNVTPGATIRILHEPATAGNITYQAIPYNASGKGQKSEKVTVFVGTDQLGNAENFAVAASTATTVDFTWDAVQGVNGGYVDASKVTYSIYTLAIETDPNWGFQYLVADQKLAEVTGETAATVNFPVDEGALQYQYFGISVKDDNTEESDPAASYTSLVVGEPEALPIEEGFADKSFHYAWNYSDNAGLLVSDDATDGDGVALNIVSYVADTDQALWLEKINLKSAANPTLIFDVKSADITSVDIIGSVDGAAFSVIASQPISSEYTTVKVPLASIVGERYTKLGISAHFANATVVDPWYGTIEEMGSVLAIDNIKVLDLYQYDMSIAVAAPASVQAGQAATIKATVKNEGENAVNGYTVIIKAGDEELLNATVNEVLQPFTTNEVEAQLETTIFDEAADVTITATVVYENDLNPDNDNAEAIISIKESTASQPEGLTGSQTDAGIELSWTAPSNGTASYTEQVEDYDEFDAGGLNADVHTGKIGEWTVYDGNGTYGYGFNGLEVPNLGGQNAWLVMAPASTQLAQDLSSNYGAHSGAQYFISTCVAEPEGNPDATNHWLISPELPGVAQTISFFARTITAQYGQESFEVLASSTDTNPASFTSVQTFSTDAVEWTEFTAELPAGTKYFAIRHTSTDIFGIMVDDITYLVGGGEVASYNIYVDGVLVATVTGDVTTYVVDPATIDSGDHDFSVSAVYTNGSESKPVTITVSVATAIEQIAADGKPVDVYSLDGKLVRQQAKSLNGLKGVYVINGKAVIVK